MDGMLCYARQYIQAQNIRSPEKLTTLSFGPAEVALLEHLPRLCLGILDSPAENKYVQGHRAFTPWNRRPTAYQASVEYSKETVDNDLQINTANDDEPPNEDYPIKITITRQITQRITYTWITN
jgi:hypothetical protein